MLNIQYDTKLYNLKLQNKQKVRILGLSSIGPYMIVMRSVWVFINKIIVVPHVHCENKVR